MIPGRAHLVEVDRLLYEAGREATALGIWWVGSDEYLLAILDPEEPSPARTALEDCGITHAVFADLVRRQLRESDPPVDETDRTPGLTMNPAAHELIGRAEGIAAGLGAPAVTREHVLIAYLWESWSSFEACGVTRQAVMQRLAALGVEMPRGELPPTPVLLPTTKVFIPYDGFMRVVHALTERLPRDSRFGFNEDGRSQAWVFARSDIDLQAEVAAVLRELDGEPDATTIGP